MHRFRPKNLDLFTIHFPLPAIVSILHRISGFILFLALPLLLWALNESLSYQGFETFHHWLSHFYVKFLFWLFLLPFSFHLIAGIRHLFADVHLGDSLKAGRAMSFLTFIITFILMIAAGIWLW